MLCALLNMCAPVRYVLCALPLLTMYRSTMRCVPYCTADDPVMTARSRGGGVKSSSTGNADDSLFGGHQVGGDMVDKLPEAGVYTRPLFNST
jgi:hypothetical protein